MSKITQPPDTNNLTPFPERIRRTLSPSGRGVIAVVDDLLGLCQEQGLQIEWHANGCRVRAVGLGPQEATVVPLPKSAFRAILARVAALCNERSPDLVSPYGGQGELKVDGSAGTVFRAAFTNTPEYQRLELTPVLEGNGKGGVRLHGNSLGSVAE